jgi:sugar transferase (PEP-CTERM/EpsH1 system associated)
MAAQPPLIVHVVNALRMGGLENGLVNLINRIPEDQFRHAIICLTDYDDFAERINRVDVEIIALHKRPGKDPIWYWRMWRALRRLQPNIVHTRNLATIETQFLAFLAGVSGRVHGEHGWDMYDLGGSNSKYLLLRKLLKPFIHMFIPLSIEIHEYLANRVGVESRRITRICNGVDTSVFCPPEEGSERPEELAGNKDIVIGYVGRMEHVKDPLNLVDAFIQGVARLPETRNRVRLAMIGDGTLLQKVIEKIEEHDLCDRTWLPGHRNDIPEILRIFNVYVLPSKAEGISNTILESMSTGLPVVATRVGGNAELVEVGGNAMLVPASDSDALSEAIWNYVQSRELRHKHGQKSRDIAESAFSIDKMVSDYCQVYRQLL